MGSHQGFVINDLWVDKKASKVAGKTVLLPDGERPRARWQARARDPHRKRYISKRFKDGEKREATAWALAEHARLSGDLSASGGRGGAGGDQTADLAAVCDLWLADLKRAGRSDMYIEDCQRTVRMAVKAGLGDLRDTTTFAMAARRWFDGITHHGRGKAHRAVAASTLNKHLRNLRACVHWAMRQPGLGIKSDPLMGMQQKTVPDTLKPTFAIHECRTLTAGPALATPVGRVVAAMLYLGLRLDAARSLRWEWFDWPGGWVRVRLRSDYKLKRQRERMIPLQPELAAWLKPKGDLQGWVFPEARDMNYDQFLRAFRRHLKDHGIKLRSRLSPHSCRHTWVALMLASGESESAVQLFAGHRDLQTTAGYGRAQLEYRSDTKDWQPGVIAFHAQEAGSTGKTAAN